MKSLGDFAIFAYIYYRAVKWTYHQQLEINWLPTYNEIETLYCEILELFTPKPQNLFYVTVRMQDFGGCIEIDQKDHAAFERIN